MNLPDSSLTHQADVAFVGFLRQLWLRSAGFSEAARSLIAVSQSIGLMSPNHIGWTTLVLRAILVTPTEVMPDTLTNVLRDGLNGNTSDYFVRAISNQATYIG